MAEALRLPLRCICLTGPTASGKTAAAMAIAADLADLRPVEIISVDSALVYRGLDIGTAKPNAQQRRAVPHHLIDILDPAEAYSAARFVAEATALIGQIVARGHLPLLVGGTMLYFKALFEGLDEMPAADAAVRAAIDAQAARDGWPAVHAELARVDPISAARLAPADTQRVQRALEVFRISGRPLAAFHKSDPAPTAWPPLISLEPQRRSWLHERIAVRLRQMLADDLMGEVQALRQRGDLRPDLPSMRCVGYRQVWEALDRGATGDLADRIGAATRQLAKRQMTWLRGMPQRETVACDRADAIAVVVALARAKVAAIPGVNDARTRGCPAAVD